MQLPTAEAYQRLWRRRIEGEEREERDFDRNDVREQIKRHYHDLIELAESVFARDEVSTTDD